MKIFKILKLSLVSSVLVVAAYSLYLFYQIQIWTFQGKPTQFVIKSGEAFSSINYRLKKQGLISNASVFYRLSKVKGKLKSFKIGTFEITPGMNLTEVIHLLTTGVGKSIKVTIQEGKNLYEIAEILESKNVIKSKSSFINFVKSEKNLIKFGVPGPTMEGYLYPDTYNFPPNSEVRLIVSSMFSNFNKRIKKLNLKSSSLTPHEVIILSSIVEKETGASFERPIIAGVFFNRLKKKMRLQSDPTTIYGIFENFNGNLRKKHLRQKTPYNTYKIPALPVGPISNPGIESIKAVLNPKKHNYLYFVSQNDGTHIFTTNYKDHLAAVKKWQKNASNRKGRSWRQLKKN